MAPISEKTKIAYFWWRIAKRRQQQRKIQQILIASYLQRQVYLVKIIILLIQLKYIIGKNGVLEKLKRSMSRRVRRRRLKRNRGWWNLERNSYSEERFKKTFRVTRDTFNYIMSKIRDSLLKKTSTENPMSPECRLGVCLHRLGRGDYYYTIAELTGLGESTICAVTVEVCQVIVEAFWRDEVSIYFPNTIDEYRKAMELMDEEWQFPFAFATIDGCHISIRCPPGGAGAAKEYHNFKNFDSIILMATVDAKYRITWASCGYHRNSHDSYILQSTDIYTDLNSGDYSSIAHQEGDRSIAPILLGDDAFPFHTWVLKPYSHATLSDEQKYFNYRLSRTRMVTEGAFGKLKGRWRALYRKCEGTTDTVKAKTLACVVLHNICIKKGDVDLRCWDIRYDGAANKRRPRALVGKMLHMNKCARVKETNKMAEKVRSALTKKFFWEKQLQSCN